MGCVGHPCIARPGTPPSLCTARSMAAASGVAPPACSPEASLHRDQGSSRGFPSTVRVASPFTPGPLSCLLFYTCEARFTCVLFQVATSCPSAIYVDIRPVPSTCHIRDTPEVHGHRGPLSRIFPLQRSGLSVSPEPAACHCASPHLASGPTGTLIPTVHLRLVFVCFSF